MVVETSAVSCTRLHSHNTRRPGPLGTIRAQPAARSARAKRPAAAEKRLEF